MSRPSKILALYKVGLAKCKTRPLAALQNAGEEIQALRYFDGQRLAVARQLAEIELNGPAACCCCCHTLLQHIHQRLGTTFFFDDNPEQLALAFPARERATFTPRVLAACILLTGRKRITARD